MTKYTFDSKIGFITLVEFDNRIVEIIFARDTNKDKPNEVILEAKKQIEEYLEGKRVNFDFAYEIKGTSFETQVLNSMKNIPYGKTLSYSQLASNAGFKGAARAVGTVCRKNKLPLLFPCHRVIKANGDIGNYAGGKDNKKLLLDLEKDYKFS